MKLTEEEFRQLPEFWETSGVLPPNSTGWIGVRGVIMRYTEAFEFAARLSSTDVSDAEMVIDVRLANIKGHQLYMENPMRSLLPVYQSQVYAIGEPVTIGRDLLLADAPRLARQYCTLARCCYDSGTQHQNPYSASFRTRRDGRAKRRIGRRRNCHKR